MKLLYLLDEEKKPYPVDMGDVTNWGKQIEQQRRVALDEVDGVQISTVFLGFDHGHGGDEPVLFETMIFSDAIKELDQEFQWRYTSYEEALRGHAAAVEIAKTLLVKRIEEGKCQE